MIDEVASLFVLRGLFEEQQDVAALVQQDGPAA